MLWYNAHSICVCRDSRRDIYYGFLRGKRDCARSTQTVPSGTVMNLFYESVHTTGCGDYTEEQFCAWALLELDANCGRPEMYIGERILFYAAGLNHEKKQ